MDSEDKNALRQMYKSGIRGTYFKTVLMKKEDLKKSRLNDLDGLSKEQQNQIDQNTFRLNRKFNPKDDHFSVYRRTGFMYNQEQSFFSCISSRRKYQLLIDNTKLRLTTTTSLALFLDFNLVSADAINKGNYFTIRVKDFPREFYFEPVDKKDSVSQWVDLLNKVIKESDGKVNGYSYLASVPNFEKVQSVSNSEFQIKANSGDILLFRSEHSAARVQQIFTNSQYDHVGIVLRNAKNQIFVFESTSSQGVGLTPWKHMIKYQWYKSTEKIVWRKLHVKLDVNCIQKIEAFVAKTLGKGFELNIQKLFVFNSAIKRSVEEEVNKTYFCSQLAARLYKQLGLIDESKSSTQYFPVDFSNKNQLKLIKQGAYLEPERIICFDGVNKKK